MKDKHGWIKVTEELPDDKGKKHGLEVMVFIVCRYDGETKNRYWMRTLQYKDGLFYRDFVAKGQEVGDKYHTVTHWQYLPPYPVK